MQLGRRRVPTCSWACSFASCRSARTSCNWVRRNKDERNFDSAPACMHLPLCTRTCRWCKFARSDNQGHTSRLRGNRRDRTLCSCNRACIDTARCRDRSRAVDTSRSCRRGSRRDRTVCPRSSARTRIGRCRHRSLSSNCRSCRRGSRRGRTVCPRSSVCIRIGFQRRRRRMSAPVSNKNHGCIDLRIRPARRMFCRRSSARRCTRRAHRCPSHPSPRRRRRRPRIPAPRIPARPVVRLHRENVLPLHPSTRRDGRGSRRATYPVGRRLHRCRRHPVRDRARAAGSPRAARPIMQPAVAKCECASERVL